MKKNASFLVIFFLVFMISAIYPQSSTKTWTETTFLDFSDNQLTNLALTNKINGEVELASPFKRTLPDTQNDTVQTFVGRNKNGDYVSSWIRGNNVYARKYNREGVPVGRTLRINEIDGSAGENNKSRAAMLDDGTYMIVWTDQAYNLEHHMWAQIVTGDTIKVAGNFRVTPDEDNFNNGLPSIIADNSSNTFIVFYSYKSGEGYRILVQRRNSSGQKIGETVFLNEVPLNIYEFHCSAVADKNGFIAVWEGGNTNISDNYDIYMRRFNWNLQPLSEMIKVNESGAKATRNQPDAAVDDNGNILVVWMDTKTPHATSNLFNCYGQVFNADGVKVGRSTQLNNSLCYWSADVDFFNGEFQVTWEGFNETFRRYESWYTRWKIEFKNYGEMISSVFNAGSSGAVFDKILWKGSTYSQNEIKFRIRSGRTLAEVQSSAWYGPADTAGYYSTSSGQKINSIHNGGSFIQYKLFLKAGTSFSPSLSEVSITYTSNDPSAPKIPESFTAVPGHSSVILNWKANSETDLMQYIIYCGVESGKYNDSAKYILPGQSRTYEDTSAETGTKYFYVITAVDSNRNESGISNEVSAVPYATDIYVSASASDGDGSESNPFRTIQEGFDHSCTGDTVRILPGNYGDAFTMKKGVSLIGIKAEECKINTPVYASDKSVIKGLTLTKSVFCNDASPLITENIFKGSHDWYAPAIHVRFISSPKITKNYISECRVGISTTYATSPSIKNNIIKVEDVGIIVDETAGIVNNTIIAGKIAAIRLNTEFTTTIQNNILVTLEESAEVVPKSQTNNHRILYNAMWNVVKPNTTVPETNLFVDPGFINMDLQDYRLAENSPCINSGNPDAIYNDMDGSRNDIGAYGGKDPIGSSLSSQLTKSISTSNASGYPGDTVSVYISLDNITGLSKADMVLEYDSSVLNHEDAYLTKATEKFTLTKSIISGNQIRLVMTTGEVISSSEKNLVEIRFVVNPETKSNDASSIIIKEISLLDSESKEINLRSVTFGAFIVNFISESSNIIYVDSRYAGVETGKRDQPFNTIMEGIKRAGYGDTVYVNAGIYNEGVTMKDSVWLIGSGASATYLTLSNDNMGVVFVNVKKGEISGFTIRADNTHFFAPLLVCRNASPVIKKNRFDTERILDEVVWFEQGSEAIFENNYLNKVTAAVYNAKPIIRGNIIEGSTMSTIHCALGASPVITNNILKVSETGGTVMMSKSSGIIRNNMIYTRAGDNAVYLQECSDVDFSNNTIIDNSSTGNGIFLNNSSGSRIVNNVINAGGRGIREVNSVSIIYSNIVMNSNSFGLELTSSSIYNYNDLWNNYVNYNGTNVGANDLSADPMFADVMRGDYSLLSSSPCINAGNPDPAYNDRDGSRNDIGAYGGPYADSASIINGSSLSMDSLSFASSDTIQVFIKGNGLEGITELDAALTFDPELLRPVGAYVCDMTKGFSVERTNENESSIKILLSGMKALAAADGDLAVLTFTAKKNASFNTSIHFESAKVKDEISYTRNIYNLSDGQIKVVSGVEEDYIIADYCLYQNYPNPFNPSTRIRYELPRESRVSIKVYDILGKETTVLMNDMQKQGKYEVEWNAVGYSSGVYFYVLNTGEKTYSRKMMLVK